MVIDKINRKKIAICASGEGSNFEAIIRYFKATGSIGRLKKNSKHILRLEFVLVVNKKRAFARIRSKRLGVKCFVLETEEQFDNFFTQNKFDLVVLAGYMKIVKPETLKKSVFINIHPSILPLFKGKDAIKRAFREKVQTFGVSIHFVNEEIDSGEIISISKFKVKKGISFSQFEKKIHQIEHKIYPKVIENLLYNNILISNLH